MRYTVGVDIGGRSAKMGVVSERGEIIFRHVIPTPISTNSEVSATAYLLGVEQLISKARTAEIELQGIGIGIPGHLSSDRRKSTYCNVHSLDHFPLVDFFEDQLQIPTLMDNDATVAALAEQRFGAGRNSRRLIVMTLGSGIGAGLIVDGTPQRPVRGCIGDPGHIIVDRSSTYRCDYGCKGCLEAVASASWMEKEAGLRRDSFPESLLVNNRSNTEPITANEIILQALSGDHMGVQIISDLGTNIGLGIASWTTIYDPDLVLIGGGISAAGELLLSTIRKTVMEYGAPIYTKSLEIGQAQMGNDAGIIGAACLALDSSLLLASKS